MFDLPPPVQVGQVGAGAHGGQGEGGALEQGVGGGAGAKRGVGGGTGAGQQEGDTRCRGKLSTWSHTQASLE